MRRLLPVDTGAAAELSHDQDTLRAAYAVAAPGQREVRVNFAASLDAAIEVDGRSDPLSGPGDKLIFKVLRSLADVVLVGESTAIEEGYRPIASTFPGGSTPIALATRTPRMDPGLPFFTEAESRPLLLVPDGADTAAWDDVADIARCGQELSLGRGLDALAERGLTRVLCEGGPRIFSSLLADDLVDEVCLTISPVLAGPDAARLLAGPPWSRGPVRLRLHQLLEDDGFLFTRWRRNAG